MYYLRVVVVVCTVYMLLLLVLCYFLPFSRFFRDVHNYNDLFQQVEKAADLRLKNARQYFGSLSPRESSQLYSNRLKRNNLIFAFGIVTVQRTKENKAHNSLGYLLQSASLLDRMLKQYAFFNSSVPFICNVDAVPQKHLDAVTLYQFMPYTERYGQNSMEMAPLNLPGSNVSFAEHTSHISKYQKETFDYAFCLLSGAALNPQYVVLVEDDTLAHADFPLVLEHIIHTRLKLHTHPHQTKFAFLKLYYPAKWQGFAFEPIRLLELVSCSVVGGSLLSLIFWYFSVRLRYVPYSQTKLFLVGCMVTMISCWLIGRQNVNELRRISKYFYRLQSSEGCCTQAMLYPVNVVTNLSHYLISNVVSEHTDLAILDFTNLSQLATYQVEPSLFYHVGFYTTLDSGQKHPEEFIFHI